MRCLDRLESYLSENGVEYQVQHHPVAFTAQEVAASEHVPGQLMAKTVVLMANGKSVLLALPAPYHVNLQQAAAALGGGEARLAQEQEFAAAFPDCEVGAIPPFGNLYGLPVYVDPALAADETIIFRAGSHTDTMSVKYTDFERLVHPTLAEFAIHD